jgi:hypothetical protein
MTTPTPKVALLEMPWLTRRDAAAVARVNVNIIGAAIRAGALVEYRGAGKQSGRIKRADLDAWIESESSCKGPRR